MSQLRFSEFMFQAPGVQRVPGEKADCRASRIISSQEERQGGCLLPRDSSRSLRPLSKGWLPGSVGGARTWGSGSLAGSRGAHDLLGLCLGTIQGPGSRRDSQSRP